MKIGIIFCFGILFLSSFVADQDSDLEKSKARGKEIYTDFCVTCHRANGEGTPKIFPPLAKSDYLKDQQNESIYSIKYGQKGKITVNGTEYNGLMPAPGLDDEEVADVMNYINYSWGNDFGTMVTEEQVKAVKK
jgi:mono/diheme cytochrome c family protein